MKKQILVIDDSKAIRFLLQTVLNKKYNVVAMPDGYSAMHWLSRKNFPDMIIADPQLPDMENWELIQQLSLNGIYNAIPMMVLSGMDKTETEANCAKYSVSGFFMKPFNPLDLVNEIDSMFQSEKEYKATPVNI